MSDHYEGKGCNCAAHSQSECCCINADWRSEREVKLERELQEAKELLEESNEWLRLIRIAREWEELPEVQLTKETSIKIDTFLESEAGDE